MARKSFFTRLMNAIFKPTANKSSNFMDFENSPDIITLHVKNSNPTTETFSVFGQNFKGGQPPGVSVTVPESSLDQATRESVFRTFLIKRMKITTTDINQWNLAFKIVTKDMTGKQVSYPMQLTNFISPQNPNQTVISTGDQPQDYLNIPIWGDVGIEGEIAPNAEMNVLLYTEFKDMDYSALRKAYHKSNFMQRTISSKGEEGDVIIVSGVFPNGGYLVMNGQ